MFSCMTNLLVGVIGFLLYVYYCCADNFDYWKKRKIFSPPTTPFFGNFKEVILGKISLAEKLKSIYDDYPEEPVVGVYMMGNPLLIVKDLDLIKDVLIKDFSHFADRGVKVRKDLDPFNEHLIFVDHTKWKPLRKKLTPVFTSGKLKEMFYLMNECAENFGKYLQNIDKSQPMNCLEVSEKFTTDVIGVCAFGLNMNSLSNEQNDFHKYGKSIFEPNWTNWIRRKTRMLPDWLTTLLAPFARNDEMINFFMKIVRETIEYRKKNNVKRNDFIDQLIEIKDNLTINEEKMSDLMITSQAFVFFTAGFETSSVTISHALYELAQNPDVQDKLREEIKTALEQNNGNISYDLVKDMTYLDKVLKETLRKYPIGFQITRKATSDYTSERLSIPKGTFISISTYAIHRDPNLYPNPDRFDPERFNDDVVKTRHPTSYIPFGEGPRNCIGERFASLQSKMGLICMLRNLKFEVCEKTVIPYKITPNAPILTNKGGIHLRAIAD